MKKRFLLLLILPLFVNSIFADEYNNLYDLIVPESFSSLTIDGGLGNVGGNSSQLNYNDNILEMTIANGSFSLDVQADASYRLYNQTETTQLDIQTTGRVWVGPIQSGLFASLNADYTSYDLDIGGLSGFWYAGGYSNINANTTFLTLNVSPKAAIGVGRVYTIYDVYRAKLMLEHLGVTPTPEKVEAVVAVFQKSNEILNQYSNDSTKAYKEYYQKLAEAMGIENRALDVLIIDIWNSQKYAFERARFVGMVNGWDARLGAEFQYEKNTGPSTYRVKFGPEAQIGGFLMEDLFYFDADAGVKLDYILNGTLAVNVNTMGRMVYLPDDYRMWAEAIVDIDYLSQATTPFQFDIAGAFYYLINNNFKTYGGLRFDESLSFSLFAGGEIRIW